MLHRVGARWWLARIMVTWGIVAAAFMFAQGPISFSETGCQIDAGAVAVGQLLGACHHAQPDRAATGSARAILYSTNGLATLGPKPQGPRNLN